MRLLAPTDRVVVGSRDRAYIHIRDEERPGAVRTVFTNRPPVWTDRVIAQPDQCFLVSAFWVTTVKPSAGPFRFINRFTPDGRLG